MTQAIHPNPSLPGEPLAYASLAPPRVGPRAWAGAAILAGGVALIGLGGCFLIGVMISLQPTTPFGTPNGASGANVVFITILYLLAFACFGGAGTLLFFGTRGLPRVMRGDWGVALQP